MALTIKEKIYDQGMWIRVTKRVLCTLSFVVFCLLDQIVGSATGSYQHAMRDYVLVAIGIITLCAYRPGDFFKAPCLAWSVVFFTLKPVVFSWIRLNIEDISYLELLSWAVWIIGLAYTRIIYQYFCEKKKPEMNWPLFGIWLAMMMGMVISGFITGNEEVWPLRFLFAFGAFYMTSYSRKDLEMLFTSLTDGVIIGFFINQGRAWLHRPYDRIRYEGMYSNCNMNALFYLVALCAVLCKWYQAKLKKKNLVLRFLYIILSGLLAGHIFLTMSRTAIGVVVVLELLFLAFQVLSRRRRRIREFVIDGIALTLSAVLCFVPSYYMVRYLPALYNDPIFFEQDEPAYMKAIKVQKNEPIDSEKYIELIDAVKGSFGRLLWFWDSVSNEVGRLFSPSMIVYAMDDAGGGISLEGNGSDEVIEPGADPEHAILTEEERFDPVKVRVSIYKFYLENLNFMGHSCAEREVWITRSYKPPHAHNLFLQVAFDFGIPVGCMFIGLVFAIYYTAVKNARVKKQGSTYYMLMILCGFTTVFVLFGMLEIDWTYGQVLFSLFFIVQYLVYHKWAVRRQDQKLVAEKGGM